MIEFSKDIEKYEVYAIMGYKDFANYFKYKKPFLGFLIITMGVFFVSFLVLQNYIENEIEKTLETNLISNGEIQYSHLDFSLFSKSLILHETCLILNNLNGKKTSFVSSKILVSGISYSEFIRTGNFEINTVVIENVDTAFYIEKDSTRKTAEKEHKTFKKTIRVKHFEIKNLNLVGIDSRNDSVIFNAQNVALKLQNAIVNNETLKSKIPLIYDTYEISSDKIFLEINPYDELTIQSFSVKNNAFIKGFSLKTKYSKKGLQLKLKTERDFIDLTIPEIIFNQFNFGFHNNRLTMNAKSVLLNNIDLDIYRNKLLLDDLTKRGLFSRKIKEIPIDFNIPTTKINKGELRYTEQVDKETKPGEIIFTDINSIIKNISNVNDDPIVFQNKANLMGVAPISIDWSFYNEKGANLFKASGVIKSFETTSLNSFLESNLRAKSIGYIDELYFTISGDAFGSKGNIKMKYHDFEFVILKKNRLGVNKLLTTMGKFFTNDGSKTDENGYRYGVIEVDRDPTKSFFNYMWINLQDGIISTFTGNGKKDNND